MKLKTTKNANVSGFILFLMLVFASFSMSSIQAQDKISGVVKDANGNALPGVNIFFKGTTIGVSTDFDGKFTIQKSKGLNVLVFSYLGYKSTQVTLTNQTELKVVLEEESQSLDEVVIIGYSAVSREKVLGSLSGVKAENVEKATPVNAFDALQGQLSGVQILSNGGPGDGFDIKIRGVSTFGGAGTNPLYVVDGQQLEDIDNLNPDDIATIEVIKDGATAAIYGSKAANGVVLITTKNGTAEKVKVNVTSVTGINQLVGDIRVANSRQRALYDKLKVGGSSNGSNSIERDTMSLLRRNSFDLQKLVTRPAIRQQINIAVQGGASGAKFYWNTGFTNEEGIVLRSGYKRLTTLLRLDFDISNKFKVGTKINLSFEEQRGLDESQVFQQLVERIPYYPVFEPDGTYSQEFGGRANPIAETTATNRTRNYRAQMFNYAQLEVLPKLTFKSTLGLNYRLNKFNNFQPIITVNPAIPIPTGRERFLNTYDIQHENYVNYKNSWGNHDLGVFAGMQIQKYSIENFDIGSNFNNEYIQTFGNADPLFLQINNNTENREHSLYSLFGGFNYDFKNKYLISGTFRYDGSSRFGESNKFGGFPSISLGWKINKEKFFKAKKLINNLMLKASYGIVGNERISDYEFTGAYGTGYIYNGGAGIVPIRLGNDELRWEETASTNLGLDLGMFKNRLTLNVDFWKKTTTDLLALVPLPEESGFLSIRKNVGSIENKGIDVSLGGTIIKKPGFTWTSNFNISYQENMVTKLDGGTPFESGFYKIEEGQPIGNIFGYRNQGVYQYNESNAYADNGTRLTPVFDDQGNFLNYTLNGSVYSGNVNKMKVGNAVLEGGDIIWQDIDGDFVITEADRQIIGNGLAKYFGGFSNIIKYKNFNLSFLFDYSFGQDIYSRWDEARNDLNSNGETPGPDRIENAWVKPGDITVYPRLNRVAQNRNTPNSFFVTNGDWIKLRYIRLDYNLPKSVTEKLKGINALSINLAVNNVLTWTNYLGFNPELGNRGNPLNPGLDNLRYPNDREIILGLKIQL